MTSLQLLQWMVTAHGDGTRLLAVNPDRTGQLVGKRQVVVTIIDNRITINAQPNRPDDEINAEILRRFELNPYLAEGLIDVQVKDGVVKLIGAVGSVNEKDIAGLLGWVGGVRHVAGTKDGRSARLSSRRAARDQQTGSAVTAKCAARTERIATNETDTLGATECW